MKRFILLGVFLFTLLASASSQNTGYFYLVKLTDKHSSGYSISGPASFLSQKSIERRLVQQIPVAESDLPVSPAYLSELKETGAEIIYTSKWLNLVILRVDRPEQAMQISRKPFIRQMKSADYLFARQRGGEGKPYFDNEVIEKPSSRTKVRSYKSQAAYNYGASLNQVRMINIDQLHALNFAGKGITIGVIDAGFNSVDVMQAFDSLRANGQILGTRDFVQPGNNVYHTGISTHGTMVLSTMGGNIPGQLIGTAPKASYWLLRSEDAVSEYLMEEYYWVNAAEFADSVGVDIINSSLGYSTFDNPAENHTYSDMDGNTTVVTIGADMAAAKGILVVNSAGNSGANAWKYITAPADGDSVLTVGAVDPAGAYAYFSSKGPTADGRIKPDVTAQGQQTIVATVPTGVAGGSGTSFSSPIIAGAAACLWQANPTFTNMELINAIRMSSSQSSSPDNLKGWGIPDFMLANSFLTESVIHDLKPFHELKTFPNPYSSRISIELTANYPIVVDIKLINSTGKIVNSLIGVEIAKGKNIIALNNLDRFPAGIYMLQVSDGYFVATEKVIK
ncbi:MAG TPA: hypothetical protein DF409_11780 [Bacteroidales bacterium]|nr:hypothetical protein [Bacteroidales bacterium]